MMLYFNVAPALFCYAEFWPLGGNAKSHTVQSRYQPICPVTIIKQLLLWHSAIQQNTSVWMKRSNPLRHLSSGSSLMYKCNVSGVLYTPSGGKRLALALAATAPAWAVVVLPSCQLCRWGPRERVRTSDRCLMGLRGRVTDWSLRPELAAIITPSGESREHVPAYWCGDRPALEWDEVWGFVLWF